MYTSLYFDLLMVLSYQEFLSLVTKVATKQKYVITAVAFCCELFSSQMQIKDSTVSRPQSFPCNERNLILEI